MGPAVAELVEQRRDGHALLERAHEVDTAQERRLLGDGALEELPQEGLGAPCHFLQGLRKEKELRTAQRLGLAQHQLGQELVEARADAGEPVADRLLEIRDAPLVVGPAQRLAQPVGRQRSRRFEEAVDAVALGDHHVDRHVHAQQVRDLVEPPAQLLGRLDQRSLVALEQRRGGEGQHHAVQGTLGPRLAQQLQQPAPLLASVVVEDLGVAAGGVEHHGLVHDPPLAVLGGAVAHEALELGGQLQARRRNQGGLARARLADHQVPRVLVHALGPALGALDRLEGPPEAVLQRRQGASPSGPLVRLLHGLAVFGPAIDAPLAVLIDVEPDQHGDQDGEHDRQRHDRRDEPAPEDQPRAARQQHDPQQCRQRNPDARILQPLEHGLRTPRVRARCRRRSRGRSSRCRRSSRRSPPG